MNASPQTAAVIGAGPAGLIAAEMLATAGVAVTLYDRMPSPGRKLLMAGRGGLNLTHSESLPTFLARYGEAPALTPIINAFPPAAVIAWAETLGQPTFVGSSGRVFPKAMKASPLLRAWLARLNALGVSLRTRQDWTGWDAGGALCFADGGTTRPDATILALGGASWPRLGADGGWTALLPGVPIAPLRPANCGFTIAWSDHIQTHFAGTPLKRIALSFQGRTVRGEAMLSAHGIEGGAVYAQSAAIRDAIAADGPVVAHLDLRPDIDAQTLARKLAAPRKGMSLSSFLRKQATLPPVSVALVQEAMRAGATDTLPDLVKALPLTLLAPRPLARAISTAGGIMWDALDENLMLRTHPGVFAAGEMLDWEAPTGGYLLQACFSTGVAAARGALAYLARNHPSCASAA